MGLSKKFRSSLPDDWLLVFSVFGSAFTIFCLYGNIIEFSQFVKHLTENYLTFISQVLGKIISLLYPVNLGKGDAFFFSITTFLMIFFGRMYLSKSEKLLTISVLWRDVLVLFSVVTLVFGIILIPSLFLFLGYIGTMEFSLTFVLIYFSIFVVCTLFFDVADHRGEASDSFYYFKKAYLLKRNSVLFILFFSGLLLLNTISIFVEKLPAIEKWLQSPN